MAKVIANRKITVELTAKEYLKALHDVIAKTLNANGYKSEYKITGYTMPGSINADDDECTVSFNMEEIEKT